MLHLRETRAAQPASRSDGMGCRHRRLGLL
jgi:hypothetical protein